MGEHRGYVGRGDEVSADKHHACDNQEDAQPQTGIEERSGKHQDGSLAARRLPMYHAPLPNAVPTAIVTNHR